MIATLTRIEIRGKTPEAIYNWIVGLDDQRYRKWHPAHVRYEVIRGTGREIGSVVRLHEEFDWTHNAFSEWYMFSVS